MKYKRDDFGNRMKAYEKLSESVLIPNLPIVVRLDGKGFSKYTKKMKRPYDEVLSNLMSDTCVHLMGKYSHIVCAYTQSDEITLIMKNEYDKPVEFNGRLQKLCSILAGETSSFFAVNASKLGLNETNQYPVFDCRIFNVPSWIEASNVILWREQDASKNSVQMLGQHNFSHKQLHGLKGNQIQEKLLLEKDINWNDYPTFFKRGTYIVKELDETYNYGRKKVVKKYFKQPLNQYSLDERLQMLFGNIE